MDGSTTPGATALIDAPAEVPEAPEAASSAPAGAPPAPEAAPFGYTLDGQPRKSRAGRPRKSGASAASSAPKTPRARTAARPKAAAGPDYRPGILGLLQLPAGALMAAGMVRPELALDGYTIAMHAPGIAEALNDLARENPAVAAMLERVMQVGPYGAIIAALVPMLVQIFVNHGMLPPGFMGAVAPEAMRAAMMPPAAKAA